MTKKIFCILLSAMFIISCIPFYASAINLPDDMTLIRNKTTVLAPGIVQNKAIAENSAGKREKIYTAEIDTRVSTVGIAVNYKDNQCDNYGMQVLSKQVAAAERNHAEPYSVVASINASFYDTTTGVPYGLFIMDGKAKVSSVESRPFFAILKDGTPIIRYSKDYKKYKANIYQALNGWDMLVYEGVPTYSTPEHDTYPSTVVGITAENKVIFMVTDGRQDPVSYGLSRYEMGQIMYSLGCEYAIMFDGGGSATFGSKEPAESAFSIKNSPSDGGERAVSTSLLVYSKAVPTGEFDHALLNCDKQFLSPGSSVNLNPVGLDSTENPAPLPESGLTWHLSDNSKGTISPEGIFTASENSSGSVTVSLKYNGETVGTTELGIVIPDTVKFSKKKMSVVFEERFLLPLEATYNGIPVAINENDFVAVNQFGYDGSVPENEIDDYGYFDGMYYVAPPEEKGMRSEVLYMISAYSESEDDVYTLTLELRGEDEAYFDFEHATYRDDEIAYFRNISNTETSDNYNYSIISSNQPVIAQYRCGVNMDEMSLPEEVAPLWDSFSGVLGDSIWEAFLNVAKKVDSSSNVKVTMKLDEKMVYIDLDKISIENDLFVLNRNDIRYNSDTNAVELIFRWNKDEIDRLLSTEEGISSSTVSPTVVVNGVKTVLDQDCEDVDGIISISNNIKISYDVIMLSDT
ncbi:MAG: phosphodiester glycosidase family protein, partial [Clostridia bacterium]|nr:phosphodiester glycosidase family protein [Clostridia bacterium]